MDNEKRRKQIEGIFVSYGDPALLKLVQVIAFCLVDIKEAIERTK